MAVRQLEEFLGQADQKGFWIFTYANLAGGFIGAFAGNGIAERIAPSAAAVKLLAIALGIVFGVITTWKVKGHPIYTWAMLSVSFVLRRYVRVGMTDSQISAGAFYRPGASRRKPFMLVTTRDGRSVPVLLHRGSGSGYDAELEQLQHPPSALAAKSEPARILRSDVVRASSGSAAGWERHASDAPAE
jgi:hypothetical protein